MPEENRDWRLAYSIEDDAWYTTLTPNEHPTIHITASVPGDGAHWEITATEKTLIGDVPSLQLHVFDDAFRAFTDAPELFQALAGREPATIGELVAILRELGAVDETRREMPEPARNAPLSATPR
ncbi:hypothetical protein PIS_073 [Saccharomonospora phage PIS 136]|nr:hypothetical protein PIS_073 [Saccharomonospora phage PIS 136]